MAAPRSLGRARGGRGLPGHAVRGLTKSMIVPDVVAVRQTISLDMRQVVKMHFDMGIADL
jgi:hypothetical protein